MQEPIITNFSKPANSEDISDLVPLNFDEYGYVLAFKLDVIELDEDHRLIAIDENLLPPEIGTISAHVKNLKTGEKSLINLKKCSEVLSEKTVAASNSDIIQFDNDDNVFCLDPKDAQMDIFKGQSEGLQI